MPHAKPQRPKQHRREDISKRVFESVIPTTWTYEPKSQREYGVDGVVEIFDNDDATGLQFNVQLKGVDKAVATKALIKTSTRNYLKELASPTLVVLVDGSDTVRFGWVHQFDLYGRKKDAASYNFDLPSVWDDNSAADIEREVRAARASLNLRSNLPILWSLDGGDAISSSWLMPFQVLLERGLARLKEFTRKSDQAGWAAVDISIASDAASIRLRGKSGGVIHFSAEPVDSFPIDVIVADVLLGLAFELRHSGLDIVVVGLIEDSIAKSAMLGRDPEFTAFATSRIVEAGREDAAVALLERVYLHEQTPFGAMVLLGIIRDRGRLDEAAFMRIAERLAEHASTVPDEAAGEHLYNAGNMLRRIDPSRALQLHDLAAKRFPEYVSRGYWWRERGEICFGSGDVDSATKAYEEAIRLGEHSAVPLLADSYAAAGDFARAIETWDEMKDVPRFVWVLKMISLKALIEELSITRQDRDAAAADALADTPDFVGLDVVALDALNPWGLWRAAAQLREAGKAGFSIFFLAAAAFGVFVPVLWFEALTAVQEESDDPEELARLQALIVLTAVQEGGDLFREFVLEDAYVPADARPALLALIDDAPPSVEGSFVVRSKGVAFDM